MLPLVVAMSACASPQGEPTPVVPSVAAMWKEQIDAVLSGQPSDFEKQALADYAVSDSEFAEARDLYAQCMTELGWVVEFHGTQGSMTIYSASGVSHDGRTSDDDDHRCAAHTLDTVESLYIGMRENPEGTTGVELIRACFNAHNVADGAGLSDDEFERMIVDPQYHPSTPEGKVCFFDPTGESGVTVEQAEEWDANKQVIAVTPDPTSR
ncbi:MAG: hypothetical protein LBI33_09065 [Propionibacteriaceae bacterium]|nr:hypothetical protein [Propionibacteriaceae bacterium]